jgi:hypothetical protein
MKNKIIELDVDFIGGLEQLTEEESKALTDFLENNKIQKSNPKVKRQHKSRLLKTGKKEISE